MPIIKEHGNSHYFFKNNTVEEAVSDGLTRWGFDSNTVYVKNPDAVPVTVQVSPNGTDWYDAAPESTDVAFIVHVTLICKYMRVSRGVGAGTVTASVVSGNITHT
jgi:hypothetical protein